MKKMVLTFEWIDDGRGDDKIVAEKEFVVKDEKEVKKDITAWVKKLYKYSKKKNSEFEVCRRSGCNGRKMWVCYGTRTKMNWAQDFMSWAVLTMCCTMNYLGWERDIDADTLNGKGYTFVSSNGVVKKFKNLTELDKFILDEMGVVSRMEEIG